MATIALYANKINQMPGLIKDVKRAVTDYQSELSALKNKTLTINKSVCDLDDVLSSIQTSTQTQEDKIASLDTFNQNSENFISDVVRVDGNVADVIKQRKDEFYDKYNYLKSEYEKNGWEKFKDACKAVGEWCKEHWNQIIATIIVIAGIILISIIVNFAAGILTTLFPFAAPLLLAAKAAITSVIISAIPGILEDIKNFDLSNTDEKVVLRSNYLSYYKGHLVIRWTPTGRSFSFGILFIDPSENLDGDEFGDKEAIDTVKHEYGHTKQLDQLGPLIYLLGIGIPSATSTVKGPPYYYQPWEVTADMYGGVERYHAPGSEEAGDAYLQNLIDKRNSLKEFWKRIAIPKLPVFPSLPR